MYPLFKYEMKRTFLSASTYVLLLLFVVLTLLPPVLNYALVRSAKNAGELVAIGRMSGAVEIEIQSSDGRHPSGEVKITAPEMSDEELEAMKDKIIKDTLSFKSIFRTFRPGSAMAIVFGIFMAIAVSREYATGFIKNLIPIKNYRRYQPLAKILTGGIMTLIMLGLVLATDALAAWVSSGDMAFDWDALWPFIGTFLVLHLALAALIVLIGNLFASSTGTIIFTVFLMLGFIRLIWHLIDSLDFLPFELMDYSLVANYLSTSQEMEIEDLVSQLADAAKLALPYLAVYTGLNLLVMDKKDINLA